MKLIAPTSVGQAIDQLDQIQFGTGIRELFIVGGDGTFNLVLNWVFSLPKQLRPDLVPIGGGEICYMARYCGMQSRNPLVNLREVIEGPRSLVPLPWSPLSVHEAHTGWHRYTAVFATGVIHRFIAWYEETGKGSMPRVFWMLFIAVLSVLSDSLREWYGRIEGSRAEIVLDGCGIPSVQYVGLVASAVPRMIPFCRPFAGVAEGRAFYAIAFWGSFRLLACILPWIWGGWRPPFGNGVLHNQPTKQIEIKTSDPHVILDGDCVRLSVEGHRGQPGRTFCFKVTRAQAIQLLCMRT